MRVILYSIHASSRVVINTASTLLVSLDLEVRVGEMKERKKKGNKNDLDEFEV